jgi:hypothetical protein
MDLNNLAHLLPRLQDLSIAFGVAIVFWLIKKAASPVIHALTHLLRYSRRRDLKRAKAWRVDPFAIQRQLAKEQALFSAFIVCTVVSFAALIVINRAETWWPVRILFFSFLMTPVIALELWWLWHKAFVAVLLEEASRIGPGFKRSITHRTASEARTRERESRRERLKKKPNSRSLVGRRMV